MLFNSLEYFLFLPAVFLLYWFVFNKKTAHQNILLLVAGYFFYGWWSWKFLILLLLSTLMDYLYAYGVASDNRKRSRLFLFLSIINNLGILAVFKYYNFFAVELQQGLNHVGLHIHPVLLNIVLSVGISFYTFHGMSYVFDIYRKERKPVSNLVDYAVFVSFFPLLVSGPIERAHHLLPQIQSTRIFNYSQAVEGCKLILWGMFKKVVIADSLSATVDEMFNNYPAHDAYSLLLGAIGFSFQIYGDFSGYSDIAIGTSKLLGFKVMSNFKFPYFSRDVAEFWRRWHISLSSWFRDYVYIPLGGSKKSTFISIRNIFIIFVLSGCWHGAGWNFIIWGAIHAAGYLPLMLLRKNRMYSGEIVSAESNLPTPKALIQMISTFAFVTFAWIFFRMNDVESAIGFIQKIVLDSIQHPQQYLSRPKGISVLAYVAPLVLIDWYFRRDEKKLAVRIENKKLRWLIYYVFMLFVLFYAANQFKQPFVYFQF